MAVEAGLSVYVVGGQGVRLFVVVVSCGVLDVFLLGGFLSRHVCDLCSVMYDIHSHVCYLCMIYAIAHPHTGCTNIVQP